MNRRSFFKVLAATAVATAVPSIAFARVGESSTASAAEILGFLGGKEYGMAVTLPGAWKKYAEWATEFLVEDARKHLPKGTVVDIRVCYPTDFGYRQGAAWYTNQKIAVSEPTGIHDLRVNQMAGYLSAGSVRI